MVEWNFLQNDGLTLTVSYILKDQNKLSAREK